MSDVEVERWADLVSLLVGMRSELDADLESEPTDCAGLLASVSAEVALLVSLDS